MVSGVGWTGSPVGVSEKRADGLNLSHNGGLARCPLLLQGSVLPFPSPRERPGSGQSNSAAVPSPPESFARASGPTSASRLERRLQIRRSGN